MSPMGHDPDEQTIRNMPDELKKDPAAYDMADCTCGSKDHCWARLWPHGKWKFHRLVHRGK